MHFLLMHRDGVAMAALRRWSRIIDFQAWPRAVQKGFELVPGVGIEPTHP